MLLRIQPRSQREHLCRQQPHLHNMRHNGKHAAAVLQRQTRLLAIGWQQQEIEVCKGVFLPPT